VEVQSNFFDFIVVGGGAAGFFAAINAARLAPGKKVVIIEKSSKVLAKVKVSGGGRCNVTHACFDNRELVNFYPRGGKELRGAFSRFNPTQTVEWFKERGVELKTESDGRMFPVSNSSETIVNCLLLEASKLGVSILMQKEVLEINKTSSGFSVLINNQELILCSKIIIAAGGSAKDAGYNFIQKIGHKIIPPVPSLFTFNIPNNSIRELMGISVEQVVVSIQGTSIQTKGPLLITHWGFSGPAILKASAWAARQLAAYQYNFTVNVNWMAGNKEEFILEELKISKQVYNAQLLVSVNPFKIVKRLWEFFVLKNGLDTAFRWADLSNKQLRNLAQLLTSDNYVVSGKTTFKEEFVTCGGIALEEIDFKFMESKKVKGLYFVGEILDIDGVTGGFNFQAAWTTGWLAAIGITQIDAELV
jgi:predicted Rossmann fold flavoprotein